MTLEITYQRLTVPQMFQKALDVFRHRFGVFLTLSAIVLAPITVFCVAMSSYAFSSLTDVIDSVNKLNQDQASMLLNDDAIKQSEILQADMEGIATSIMNHAPFFFTIIFVQTVVFSVLTISGRGAMIRATAEIYASVDAEPQWLLCFQLGLSRFWSLFCAGLLMGFGCVVLYGIPVLVFFGGHLATGLLLLIIGPCILCYCLVRFALLFPAIVIEDLSAIDGLKRSWELSRNFFCDIFCAIFVSMMVFGLISSILVNIVGGGFGDPVAAFRPLGMFISQSLGVFVGPYMAILTTILYFNMRITKEGMNQTVLSRELIPKEYQGVPLLDLDVDEQVGYNKLAGDAALSKDELL